jgi:hypothetical protein
MAESPRGHPALPEAASATPLSAEAARSQGGAGGLSGPRRPRSPLEETFGRTERELQAERAACLARIGRALEARLALLAALRGEIEKSEGRELPLKLAHYEEVRREAERYLFYLKVQRAANGLHDDALVDRIYRVPGFGDPHQGA